MAAGAHDQAAQTFSNPDWRGVAEYAAGAYDAASQSFAGDLTADNLYNLGNSLALQGDLKGALKAYEESLAREPDAEDAIANRDFINPFLISKSRKMSNRVMRKIQSKSSRKTGARANQTAANPRNPLKTASRELKKIKVMTALTARAIKVITSSNRVSRIPR